ncbi:hypothetical protein [Nocardioides ferulae]|uniref:hypothetical protein n=1 Tax=Nocardioides ferulae TaxID=2340821 RepID=UPI000F87F5CD|nr:hypothetical protein [Nocardioides ferulae]
MLSLVHPWPAQGRADRPTDADPVADVAIRGCRSVAELYSEAVAGLGLPSRVGELRLFHRHEPALDHVRATVHVDPGPEGFEVGHVQVPTAFADRTPEARAQVLLDAMHGMVCRLAAARGWDVGALERCRRHVVERGMEYHWSSQPKASPDRRHTAYAELRLPPDGYGRVRLLVARRDDGTVVASSDEALAFCTSQGFRRSAASLRWSGKDHVSLVPYDWVPAVRGGLVGLTRDADGWHASVEDYLAVRPVPAGDPGLPALDVVVEGAGATAPEQVPEVTFVGGGPIESRRVERFHRAFRAEMHRFASPAGQEWWGDSGLRLLEVQIFYGGDRPRVRGRRTDQRLAVFVDRPGDSLPIGDQAPVAREVVEEVAALVRRRTGLGPHPGLSRG